MNTETSVFSFCSMYACTQYIKIIHYKPAADVYYLISSPPGLPKPS